MPQIFLKKRICKAAIIFTALFFASCAPKDDKPQIRIVDLDGRAHSVVTRMPELNKRALTSQGVMSEQPAVFENNLPPQQQDAFAQNSESQLAPDYGVLSQDLAPKKQPIIQEEISLAAGKQESPTIEYDLSSPEEDAKPSSKSGAKKLKETEVSSDSQKGLFVQAGAFSSEESAKTVLLKMEKFHKGHIEIVDGEVKLHRVLLGPFKSKNKALALVNKIKASGHEAVLMRNK